MMRGVMTIRQYNRRMIVAGNVIEIYEYEKPICKGFAKKRVGRGNSMHTSQEIKQLNRGKTAQRARATVRRTANANPQLNKFLTLTYAENMTDLTIARKDFDKFVKRVKTRFKNFQFIVVIEFQARGAVHFHLLCNLPFVDVNELASVWGHGFVKINSIDNVDNVGAYITKYMTKENADNRLIGRKCYSMSKDLNKADTYTKEEEIEEVLENLENVKRTHTVEFESEYYGVVTYTQMVCSVPIVTARKCWRDFFRRHRDRLTLFPDDTPCPF